MTAAPLFHPHDHAPADGELVELAPGLGWIRMPLPFPPHHINLYVVAEPDGGWTLVDTGVDDSTTRELWPVLEAGALGGASIRTLLVSHWHADHAGLAGWLCDRHVMPMLMAPAEHRQCLGQHLYPDDATLAAAADFYRRQGLAEADTAAVVAAMSDGPRRHGPLPAAFTPLADGQWLEMGGRRWRILLCGGHAFELVAAWSPDLNVLFTSDQVLPLISPHVGVMVAEPGADMLGRFLDSLARLKALVPADALVLPSHNLPFVGLHQRVDELLAHHHRRCDAVVAAAVQPASCAQLLPALFRRRFEGRHLGMAVREALAHINHMVAAGRLVADDGGDGVIRYRVPAHG